uniref:Uncharacterized protein n=1 Tax=Oryza nivara TaxID=4536 RepID=A0A0E0I1J2_ORYNI
MAAATSGYEGPCTRGILDAARAGDVEMPAARVPSQRRRRRGVLPALPPRPGGGGLDAVRTCGGNTALHIAAGLGHAELALFLCHAERPLLELRNHAGETPLHLASKAGHARVVGNLLDVLVSPADDYAAAAAAARAVNRSGETALHEAARAGRPRGRDRVGDLAGVVSGDGASPLYLAAMEGHEGVVWRLLRRLPVGTMVSAASYAGPDGQTALHAAVLLRETGK